MSNERIFDPTIQTEEIGYGMDELIVCATCGRKNGPDRGTCIYCGNTISNAVTTKPNTLTLESWENGFNVIVSGGRSNVENRSDAILEANVPLPHSRLSNEETAKSLAEELATYGLACSVIGDAELDLDRPPVRISKIEFRENFCVFVDLNTNAVNEIPYDQITLIVKGAHISSRSDIIEKRKRGKDATTIDDTFADNIEPILDVYSKGDACGFRVQTTGFDFSCLGERMTLLATDNIELLANELLRRSPLARYIENYRDVRPILETIWPTEYRRDSNGLQRVGIGKLGFGRSESSNNQVQFNRFSRLQFRCL